MGLVKFGAQLGRDALANYQNLSALAKLQKYAQSRLPAELASRGPLVPLGSGTGRKAFALGEDMIVKVPRMPRGVMENRLATDTYAPIPELIHQTDDNLLSVVRRAEPADKELRRMVKRIEQERMRAENFQHPEWSGGFQEAVQDAGFGDLLNYDALWGDIAPRNVGRVNQSPVLLDEGILSRDILNPRVVAEEVPLDFWREYRGDVMRKAEGGLVDMAEKYDAEPQKFAIGGLARKFARKAMSQMDEHGQSVAAPQGSLSMFIGPKSALWKADDAARFEKLEKAGVHPHAMWNETGTLRGPEGALRQEIPDDTAALMMPDERTAKAAEMRERMEALKAQNKAINEGLKEQPDLFPRHLKAAQKGLRDEVKSLKELLSDPNGIAGNREQVRGSVVVDHPLMFEAYPDMKERLFVKYGGGRPGERGALSGDVMSVYNDALRVRVPDPRGYGSFMDVPTPDQARSTMLHEAQHWIQDAEKFAPGGSPEAIAMVRNRATSQIGKFNDQMSRLSEYMDAAKAQGDTEAYAAARAEYDSLMDQRGQYVPHAQLDPVGDYYRLAGETEARLTQARRDLNAQQRRERFPYLDLAEDDYPPEKQLVMDWNKALR